MYLNNADLEFLIKLENRLGALESWSKDVKQLWKLNEKLLKQRKKQNEKTAATMREKRKTNPNYGR